MADFRRRSGPGLTALPRCIIHIGHAKTATTYLQQRLHLNQDRFAELGYWLPSDFRPFGFHDCVAVAREGRVSDGNLGPLFYLMSTPPYPSRAPMKQYLFTSDGRDVVVSSELFFYYPNGIKDLVQYVREFDLVPELVAYLPRQDSGVISAYLQNVRAHDYSFGVIDFLCASQRVAYCDYLRVLTRIAAAVPGVAITLRSFHPPFLRNGDVFDDFLSLIDPAIDPTPFARPAQRINSGLLLEEYELLRAANILRHAEAKARLRVAAGAQNALDRARVQGFYYRPEIHEDVQRNYIADNPEMLRRFMPAATLAEQEWWSVIDKPGEPIALDEELLTSMRKFYQI